MLVVKCFLQREQYYDSVFLMRLAAKLGGMPGIRQISAGMGTPLNKDTMRELGVLDREGAAAGVNDLVVGIAADTEKDADSAYAQFAGMLKDHPVKPAGTPVTIAQALRADPDSSLAMIEVAGEYAGREGMKALKKGLNVYMFSDHVPIEQEAELKNFARDRGLLMMGPDCGLCFLDGVAVGLCSKTRRGNIGIVGASGSGIQEVMCLIHRQGFGISQAIGTGGRDLWDEVGGITMLQGIDLLESDPDTAVIVLISKPPAPRTMEKVLNRVRRCRKPVVVQFVHGDPGLIREHGAHPTATFLETAEAAIAFSQGKKPGPHAEETDRALARAISARLGKEQKYLRGLYCGGSLAEETLTLLSGHLSPLYSNDAFGDILPLNNPLESVGHCLVDMGAEEFTRGRPHVAIDPSIRLQRFEKEARDRETAVILLDVLLGYALHEDPGGMLAPVIAQNKALAAREGRELCVIIALCGTDLDPQGYEKQKACLEAAGAIVLESNEKASLLAREILSIKKEEGR